MGAKDSKRACLPYEDAVKRMSDEEFKRVCEAFKRLSGGNPLLSKQTFIQNVLGDGVPQAIAEWLYTACGGGPRGIALKDLICGLVLLTKGKQDEKIRFLWTLYCNDSGTHILKNEFYSALQVEGTIPPDKSMKTNLLWERTMISLFGVGQDRVTFEHFSAWIQYNKEATILSKWLLSNPCVSLSSEVEAPTFYQTLAGVTHLEEQDICELEKCFWTLQSSSPSGHLDLNCVRAMVCPPVPVTACEGLFLALDVNRDGHVDFKELCCGISAACRGPTAERMKFCFKIFDMDRDLTLNPEELNHMVRTLLYVSNENDSNKRYEHAGPFNFSTSDMINNGPTNVDEKTNVNGENKERYAAVLDALNKRLDAKGCLSQEEFLVWSVEDNTLVEPMLELLFQVCHVSFVLKPHCRHHEREIVMGWLEREQRRGYHVGQFWYLISSDWWQTWYAYTTGPRNSFDHCGCRPELQQQHNHQQMAPHHANGGGGGGNGGAPHHQHQVEEGIVCDESLISTSSTDYTNTSNECNSNSMESMGDLLSKGDSCSIASSSGVSSSSGTTGSKRGQGMPGPIENSCLVAESPYKVGTLTGEGGRLRRDTPLVQHRDFELVPDSLWKALAHWYGGPLPLPRQVILPPGNREVELELYPLNLSIWRHQSQQSSGPSPSWSSMVGGYGAAALSGAGITAASSSSAPSVTTPRRYLAHTAAFSRLANVRQVVEFLCARLALRVEDVRLWHVKDHHNSNNNHSNSSNNNNNNNTTLLEDENVTLQDLGVVDGDKILLEVRNKDLTWPEELGALAAHGGGGGGLLNSERRPTICLPPGATGLHNLGNTCFMNAALQAVSNTRPLTMYFQRDGQLCELNSMNPLGTKGMVARRYAELCRELWAGSTRSVAPLKLRYCVTKHAPHLGGGGQHDSQELLAWLLDALHEDLNRVAKKQYTELKDSGGRPDEIVADEAWTQHLARDHSIITDLFYGQLKSKVTCQTCGHESVRFDPFNLLSLPLPMESYVLCEVLVVRLNGSTPVKYGLRLNSEAKYAELKQQLHAICGIASECLLLAEVAYSQIRQILNDDVRINPSTTTEIYAYELPDCNMLMSKQHRHEPPHADLDNDTDLDAAISDSPLARSPETTRDHNHHTLTNGGGGGSGRTVANLNGGVTLKKCSIISVHSRQSSSEDGTTASAIVATPSTPQQTLKFPNYLVAVHRKCVRQETYFLSQQKSKPSLFGMPLLLGCCPTSTCQSLYEEVWGQVTRLLSPLPQRDQTNHALDCDDSLGYEFPFTLKAVLQGGQICAICHWTQFCRGCTLPCSDDLLVDRCKGNQNAMCIAIDWDPTALHLRYQSSREKLWIEDESVERCRKLHTEPIDLDYCLRAFTSEERLEAKYHCSNCQDKQPATKKLQIWRLPPILIIHLKRFDCVNNKWVKTQKVVNFPFKNFDPTAYLASVPQETILRHHQLQEKQRLLKDLENSCDSQTSVDIIEENGDDESKDSHVNGPSLHNGIHDERSKLLNGTGSTPNNKSNINTFNKDEVDSSAAAGATVVAPSAPPKVHTNKMRTRLESTSLQKTPIQDENLKDYHQHKLLPGQDPFDLKYQLYAVVSHSGLLTGGHYISYACNPNGNWYCYNDSSCREVITAPESTSVNNSAISSCTTSSTTTSSSTTTTTANNSDNTLPRNNNNNNNNNTTNNNNNRSRKSSATGCTPLSRRKPIMKNNTTADNDGQSVNGVDDQLSNKIPPADDVISCKSVGTTATTITADLTASDSTTTSSDSGNCSSSGSTTYKCAYSDVKIPKIDTSSAYILFYERSGLDYKPYLPPDIVVTSSGGGGGGDGSLFQNGGASGQIVMPSSAAHHSSNHAEVDLDDNELRKQLCTIQ